MSAFLPNFKHDVFVSYARVDDQPLIPGDEGSCWVLSLKSSLQMLLNQKAKGSSIWMDLGQIAGNEPIPEEIRQGISSCATLLIIMSDGYLDSNWCRQELESFIEAAGSLGVAGRIFVVHREEIPFDHWPAALRDLNGYPFYLKDLATGDVRPMAVPKPDPQEKEYFARLYRLRNELAKHLQSMKATASETVADSTPATPPDASTNVEPAVDVVSATNSDEPTVFLAEVTGDLYEHREQVAECLTQSGCRVLPTQFYSRTPSDFKAAMDRDLARSAVYAQLLGPYPTPRTKNLPQGYEGLQLEQALAANKPVLQWRSPDLDPTKVRDDLHRQLVAAPNVLATDLEEFKRIISETLRKTLVQTDRVTSEGDTFILLSAVGVDMSVADAIARRLTEHNVAFDIVDEGTSLSDLADSDEYDGLMVVYGDCPQDWVQQQVRVCRRVALRKKHLAPECAVFVGPPHGKEPLRCRPPRFHVIDHDDQARLESYIMAVRARSSA